jgi:putative sigma-54 modulation protein
LVSVTYGGYNANIKSKGVELMKVNVTGRNLVITDAIREQVEKKLSKFDKMFNSDIEASATFSVQKNKHIVEVTIPLKNGALFRAEAISDDMYMSIDEAIDRISKQMKKHKTKLEKRFHANDSIRFEEIPDAVEPIVESSIVKTKRFGVKPMGPEEAVLQMELLGHDFFVFLNGDTEEINVVYKRKDGDFGLIEPYL